MRIFQKYKKFDAALFRDDADVRTDLGLDSLQIASAAGDAEEAFDVTISDEAVVDAVTVADWLRLTDA